MVAQSLVFVTQPGCNPCKRVKRLLDEIKSEEEFHDLTVEEVVLSSETGVKLALEYQILYPPAIIIGDKLVAKGKIYKEQLVESLRNASPQIVSSPTSTVSEQTIRS